jgi:hypothetical protein
MHNPDRANWQASAKIIQRLLPTPGFVRNLLKYQQNAAVGQKMANLKKCLERQPFAPFFEPSSTELSTDFVGNVTNR